MRDLAGGEAIPFPAGAGVDSALDAALGGCGRVEKATSDFLFLRFPDALPRGPIRARAVTTTLEKGWLLPCDPDAEDVVGSCWRVPYDSHEPVYDGDPVICLEPIGGRK